MRLPRRASRTALLLAAAASTLLALGACGGGEAGRATVHLDPRLPDGRSPRGAFEGARLAEEVPMPPGPDAPWTARGALAALDGGGAVGQGELALERTAPLPHDALALEVVVRCAAEGELRLSWSGGEALRPLAARPSPEAVHVPLPAAAVPLEYLQVGLTAAGGAPVELHAVRLYAGRATRGLDAAPALGDFGLVALGREARRAWASDLGVPLLASLVVPQDGRLATWVAPSAELTGRDVAVRFAVDVRAAESDFRPLASRLVEAPADAAHARWTLLEADLAGLAGESVELLFLATAAGAAGAGAASAGEPRRASVLFGTPEVRGRAPRRRPNVLLVTLDTTRADAALDPRWAPNLARLAERGLRFPSAWAAASSTVPSHASILTGRFPAEHGAIGNRHVFPAGNRTLAERLREEGWHTAAATSVPFLAPGWGFGHGFDRFHVPGPGAAHDGARTVDAVLPWLAEWGRHRDAPFFLWVHLFDPHTPYTPPEEFVRSFLQESGLSLPPAEADPPTLPLWSDPPDSLDFLAGIESKERVDALYRLGVAYADHLLGRVLDALEEHGLAEDTAVVVTADHGESLGEGQRWYQHVGLFPEVLHVPLVLAPPPSFELRAAPAGRDVDLRASGVDLVPTVLRIAGLPPDPSLPGADLLALALAPGTGAGRKVRFQQSALQQSGLRGPRWHFAATRRAGLGWDTGPAAGPDGERRVLETMEVPVGTLYLYDHVRDPSHRRNLASELPDEAARAAADVDAWCASLHEAVSERRPTSAEEERELSALGYGGTD